MAFEWKLIGDEGENPENRRDSSASQDNIGKQGSPRGENIQNKPLEEKSSEEFSGSQDNKEEGWSGGISVCTSDCSADDSSENTAEKSGYNSTYDSQVCSSYDGGVNSTENSVVA